MSASGLPPDPLPYALVENAGAYHVVEHRVPREGEAVYVRIPGCDRSQFTLLGVYSGGKIVAGGGNYDLGEAIVQGVVIGEVTAVLLDGETATSPRL